MVMQLIFGAQTRWWLHLFVSLLSSAWLNSAGAGKLSGISTNLHGCTCYNHGCCPGRSVTHYLPLGNKENNIFWCLQRRRKRRTLISHQLFIEFYLTVAQKCQNPSSLDQNVDSPLPVLGASSSVLDGWPGYFFSTLVPRTKRSSRL